MTKATKGLTRKKSSRFLNVSVVDDSYVDENQNTEDGIYVDVNVEQRRVDKSVVFVVGAADSRDEEEDVSGKHGASCINNF